jgi:hypothetical protein
MYFAQNTSKKRNSDLPKRHLSLLIVFLILSILIPVCYSIYTKEIWEDSLITLRYSKNLIDGNGLVYNSGERVHGFTSPLGMLLLAFCYLITHKANYFYVFWAYRIICISVFASACSLLLSIFLKRRENILIPIWMGVLFIFEAKSVAFTINGMETVFMLFFLAAYFYIISDNLADNWISAGICWAGLMWTRPDGCVYIMALAFSHILYSGLPKRENLAMHLKIAAVCTVLYLPWFIFSWSYFGSPIPHTILAKLHYPVLLALPEKIRLLLDKVSGPSYYYFGQRSWPFWFESFFLSTTVFAIFYWIFPSKDRFIKIISLSCFFVSLYLFSMNMSFPWYFPPLKLMSSVVLIQGLFGLMRKRARALPFIILILFCGTQIYVFVQSAIPRRVYQIEIEEGNRKLIGLWLKNHMLMSDRVFLEPIGYIGYFSERKIIDYPGLISPEIVQLMNKDKSLDFHTLVPKVQPEWLVIRYGDSNEIFKQEYVRKNYSEAKRFDVSGRLGKYKNIAGIEPLLFDTRFIILQKISNARIE